MWVYVYMHIWICTYSLTCKHSHILTEISLPGWIHVCQYDTKALQSDKSTFPQRMIIWAKLDSSAFYTSIPKCSYQYSYIEKNRLNEYNFRVYCEDFWNQKFNVFFHLVYYKNEVWRVLEYLQTSFSKCSFIHLSK